MHSFWNETFSFTFRERKKKIQWNCLMHDILKWIRNIWLIHLTDGSSWQRCTFKSNRKSKKIAQIESVMRYRGNTFILLPYTFTYKCASIQAIKLIRLIYWAWIHREKNWKREKYSEVVFIHHALRSARHSSSTNAIVSVWVCVCVSQFREKRCLSCTLLIKCSVLCFCYRKWTRKEKKEKHNTHTHTNEQTNVVCHLKRTTTVGLVVSMVKNISEQINVTNRSN